MDSFTKRYTVLLVLVALAILITQCSNRDTLVEELNDALEDDLQLAEYPYQFRVVSRVGSQAIMNSPRSAQVSVIQALRIIHPGLKNAGADSIEMQAAQEKLALTQSLARRIVLQHPKIENVVWELDTRWLEIHGVALP